MNKTTTRTPHVRIALSLMMIFCLTLSPISGICGDEHAPAFAVVLREGDSGELVRAAQTRLSELGYFEGAANGTFSANMTAAVLLFQKANHLLQSGMLDKTTWDVLFSEDTQTYAAWQKSKSTLMVADEMPMSSTVRNNATNGGWTAGASFASAYSTNEYAAFAENGFLSVATNPLSTFAADVDTASYAKLRAAILAGDTVPPSSVRIEEMLNYFTYDYAQPVPGEPFGVTMTLSDCPWNPETKLLLIGIQAERIKREECPRQNLVFLIDVSGSMDAPDKLPLVKRAFSLLLEQLAPTDTLSIVTYASRDEIVLDGVPAANKAQILAALDSLTAGGMTAGAAGITTAYALAERHWIEGGVNRVLLATDGDLNIGISDEGTLARLVESKKESGVFLSVLGFGDGNYKDNKLEALADHGNGNYHYIDTIHEARRALVTEMGATFITVAKDVKLQLDFNPAKVMGYRLIGYEDRLMSAEDFANDQKDGGELGSGHRVTVLYELVPVGSAFDFGQTESRYQAPTGGTGEEWLTLSLREKAPDGDVSTRHEYPLTDAAFTDAPCDNLRFAAAVAEVGMLLRDSEWRGSATYESALALLRGCGSVSGDALKEEFLYLVTLLDRAE